MSDSDFKLAKAPIVEAVIEVDCDMPPGFELAAMEKQAVDRFGDQYPNRRSQFVQEAIIETKANETPQMSVRQGVQSLLFLTADEKQLVQVRMQGFSFNRLAPYTSLDAYLSEIKRTWDLFNGIVSPVQIRAVRLRYVNRILLPSDPGNVRLEDYLKTGPRLPDEENLTLAGFFNQHAVVEPATGNQANIVMASQPRENGQLPLIFDISVARTGPAEPADWPWISDGIASLRRLKNRIFRNTLTNKCLNLFH